MELAPSPPTDVLRQDDHHCRVPVRHGPGACNGCVSDHDSAVNGMVTCSNSIGPGTQTPGLQGTENCTDCSIRGIKRIIMYLNLEP